MDLLQYALSAFVVLSVTIGPLSTAVLFAGMTARMEREAAAAVAVRGVAIATVVLVVFGLVGERLLALLHVTTAAFQLAGGLLLLLMAVELVFAKTSGVSSLTVDEAREAAQADDIAVFPLAIPLLAGPGAMTAMVLLVQHASDGARLGVTFVTLGLVMVFALTSLWAAPRLNSLLGMIGVNVISRVSGVLLAAVAMQFLLDGWNSGISR